MWGGDYGKTSAGFEAFRAEQAKKRGQKPEAPRHVSALPLEPRRAAAPAEIDFGHHSMAGLSDREKYRNARGGVSTMSEATRRDLEVEQKILREKIDAKQERITQKMEKVDNMRQLYKGEKFTDKAEFVDTAFEIVQLKKRLGLVERALAGQALPPDREIPFNPAASLPRAA